MKAPFFCLTNSLVRLYSSWKDGVEKNIPPLQNFQCFSIPKFRETYNTHRVFMSWSAETPCCVGMISPRRKWFSLAQYGKWFIVLKWTVNSNWAVLILYVSLPFFFSQNWQNGRNTDLFLRSKRQWSDSDGCLMYKQNLQSMVYNTAMTIFSFHFFCVEGPLGAVGRLESLY